jgi:hypothetical protein
MSARMEAINQWAARILEWFWAGIGWQLPTALEKAIAENIRLKAMLHTRQLEAENVKLREDLGL